MQPVPEVRPVRTGGVPVMRITVNGAAAEVPEGLTVLEAARLAGADIPTLCHLKGVCDVGACRVCVVEVEGAERLVPACTTRAFDGMVVSTATARVLAARRTNVQLLLSMHDGKCLTCPRNGTCELQKLAQKTWTDEPPPFPKKLTNEVWRDPAPIVRTPRRCVLCLRCVRACEKELGPGRGVWELLDAGRRAHVGVRGGRTLEEAGCTLCNKCVQACPTGALTLASVPSR